MRLNAPIKPSKQQPAKLSAIFSSSSTSESKTSQNEEVEIAPIPLPVDSSDTSEGPLLMFMNKTKTDPEKFEQFKKRIPEAPSPSNYQIPVEAFGKAMLQGMGFSEDDENNIQPYLLEGRPNLLGLGAKVSLNQTEKQSKGTQRQYLAKGSVCQIDGTHRFAVITQTDGVPGLDMVKVRTFKSLDQDHYADQELIELEVPRKKIILVTNFQQLPETHPAKLVYALNEKLSSKTSESFLKKQKTSNFWVREGLRVLYVNERDSENYKKKAQILEVDESGLSTIQFEKKSGILKDVKEKYLQTLVSDRPNAQVLVVAGKRKRGQIGNLVTREKSKNKALLKFDDDTEEWFELDDISEISLPSLQQ